MINKKLCEIVINQLKSWKLGFLSSNAFDDALSYGVLEFTDYLDGISYNNHDCYASFLFNQLTEFDKEYILMNIDFDVDFDEIYSTYYKE